MNDEEILQSIKLGSHVIVKRDKYADLLETEEFMNCLRAAGIDNTEAYAQACQMMPDDEDDFDEDLDTFDADDELPEGSEDRG